MCKSCVCATLQYLRRSIIRMTAHPAWQLFKMLCTLLHTLRHPADTATRCSKDAMQSTAHLHANEPTKCSCVWYICDIHIHGVATIRKLLKIYVSFAAYHLLYRALLQKKPIILRSLLIAATPYHTCVTTSTLHKHRFKLRYSCTCKYEYGVASISRLLKIIGLFCKRAL